MEEKYYLLTVLYATNNFKQTGHSNIYIAVEGPFVLRNIVIELCKAHGWDEIVVLNRMEVTKTEYICNVG